MTYQEKKAKRLMWEEYLKECEEEFKEDKRRELIINKEMTVNVSD